MILERSKGIKGNEKRAMEWCGNVRQVEGGAYIRD